jgi:hypothetical protein
VIAKGRSQDSESGRSPKPLPKKIPGWIVFGASAPTACAPELAMPADVRQYIARICKDEASAAHDFATYSPRVKRWRINLEYLRCNGLGEYRRGNQCLDVDFIEVGTRYRLGTKVYRDCGY